MPWTATVLQTESDYENALARAWDLMDAVAGTPEGDELKLLATLIEAYEDKHYPIDPPDAEFGGRLRQDQ